MGQWPESSKVSCGALLDGKGTLYDILENQTFERMFSHPKSKLDLFADMNSEKVILINTAKDQLKENGTQTFGRFFIALIVQVAQERATLAVDDRLFSTVYVDEARDYFDQNTAVILGQARKYNFGMALAHQYLTQLDEKLQEAVSTNTAIKFVGGVSAKDAKAMSAELPCDANLIESQPKLSFATYVAGETNGAVSFAIEPGQMEALPTMSWEAQRQHRDAMREGFAVHHSVLNANDADEDVLNEADDDGGPPISTRRKKWRPPDEDDGEPDRWE